MCSFCILSEGEIHKNNFAPGGSMNKCSPFVTVMLLVSISFGASLTQSDWSVPGSPGPFRDLSGSFLSSQGVNWWSTPGTLVLGFDPLRHGADVLPGLVASVLCEDMDEDGDDDIVICEFRGRILLYQNTGTGGTFMVHTVFLPEGFGPERIVSADFDGDGDTDLAGTSRGDGTLSWWENTDTDPWPRHILDPGEGTPFPLDAGDVDGDGDQDLLIGTDLPGRLLWMENRLDEGEWISHEVDGAIPAPQWVEAGQGDGYLAATSFADSAVYLYQRLDDRWTRITEVSAPGPLCVGITDMDGDGVNDITACSSLGDSVFWQQVEGHTAQRVIVSQDMIAPCQFTAEDLDGDGDSDLLGVSEAAGELVWWENTDNGKRFFPHYAAGIPGCSSCATGDLDGDGRIDAVAGSMADGSLSWVTLGDFADHGSLTSSILYLGPEPGSLSVEWNGSAQPGTSVELFVRLSPDRTRMGNWVEAAGNPADLTSMLSPDTRFLQYRIELFSTDRGLTPSVESVSFNVGSGIYR